MISKLIRLFELMEDRDALKAFLKHRRYFSIASYKINAALVTYNQTFNTIIDVGANVGQFCIAASERFPEATIHSFEPVPDVYEQLMQNAAKYPRIHSHNLALGDKVGVLAFYRNDYTQVSSALSISKDNRQPNYDATRVKQLDVDMVTLDDIVNSLNLEKPVLLKLDVQGYERNVLDGARETLQYVDSLVLEVPFVQLYDEQLLFPELNDYLERLDFHFVAPLYYNTGSDHSIIEMDVLYHPGKRHI